MSWDAILIAGALFLILEGLAPLIIPNKYRKFLTELSQRPIDQIQKIGAAAVICGLLLLLVLSL